MMTFVLCALAALTPSPDDAAATATETRALQNRRTEVVHELETVRAIRKRRELGVSLMVGGLAPPLATLVGIELFGMGVGASYFADSTRGGGWPYAPLGAALGLVVTPRLFGQAPFSTALSVSLAAASAFVISGLIVFVSSVLALPDPLRRLIQLQGDLREIDARLSFQ